MGIKSILTLVAVGGIAGGAYYFKDSIKDAFASGKDKIENLKDELQDGYQDTGGDEYNQNITYTYENDNNKGNSGKDGNGKGDNGGDTGFVYIPVYQDYGQQSTDPEEQTPETNKPNPEITKYIAGDRQKTLSTLSIFTSPENSKNPDKYAKEKYGIDYDTLTKAVSKAEPKRTIDEKKAIEAAKAREIFDSRDISNW